MASYQDFSVQKTNLTGADMPTLSGGQQYYIVGVSSGEAGTTNRAVQGAGGSPTLIQIPPRMYISIPGRGMPVDTFRCEVSDVQVFYYIK